MNKPVENRGLNSRVRNSIIISLLLLVITGVLTACSAYKSTEGSSDSLDVYEIGVLPHLREFLKIKKLPDAPFVMVNLQAYKDHAAGADFEGLTGREAYQLYLDGLVGAQKDIGSRLIWAGEVQSQIIGFSEPLFETIGLLEYARPEAFTTFAKEPGEAPKARTAGLLGQWLLASTTLNEANQAVEPRHQTALPPQEELTRKTGLTGAQIDKILDGPAEAPIFIVDLLRFADESGELYQPYRETLSEVAGEYGSGLIWRGAIALHVIGKAAPGFHEVVVTRYSNRSAYLSVLSDNRVVAKAESRTNGLALQWSYLADEESESDLPK